MLSGSTPMYRVAFAVSNPDTTHFTDVETYYFDDLEQADHALHRLIDARMVDTKKYEQSRFSLGQLIRRRRPAQERLEYKLETEKAIRNMLQDGGNYVISATTFQCTWGSEKTATGNRYRVYRSAHKFFLTAEHLVKNRSVLEVGQLLAEHNLGPKLIDRLEHNLGPKLSNDGRDLGPK